MRGEDIYGSPNVKLTVFIWKIMFYHKPAFTHVDTLVVGHAGHHLFFWSDNHSHTDLRVWGSVCCTGAGNQTTDHLSGT